MTGRSSILPLVFVSSSLFLLSPTVATGSASIRGSLSSSSSSSSSSWDPSKFVCTTTAFDADSCKATKSSTDDPNAPNCVWCTYQDYGMCFSPEQSEKIAEKIPQITCNDGGDEESTTTTENVDDDQQEEVHHGHKELWDCLMNGQDSDNCMGNCTWCDTQAGYGFCLTDDLAEALDKCPWFNCTMTAATATSTSITTTTTASSNNNNAHDNTETKREYSGGDPIDTSCLTNGGTTAESCHAAKDENGNACVWCDAAGVFSICMSSEQAQAAGQYLTCDGTNNNNDNREQGAAVLDA